MRQLLLELAPQPEPLLANFVPGRNGAALQALTDIAAGTSTERFVYLWGDAGSGRTHLLRGLVQATRANERGISARYLPARESASLSLAALAADSIVAVDEVQALAPEAQVALFDLYNRVRAAGGSLVASGDATPAQLALREDLRSRLAWGLAYQLHPLSDAEKAAALAEHARARGLVLPQEVIAYLLAHAARDMKSLIAIVDALDRYSLERKRPITLPLVREALEAGHDSH